MADTDFSGVTNPKRVIDKRIADAEGDDGKKGRNMGDLPDTPAMTQAQFSGYTKKDNKAGLEKALKNRK